MEKTTGTNRRVHNINKPAYSIFLLAGIYFLIQKDLSQAVTFWGLALVFDPFNTEIPFNNRPAYQQIWLFVHAAITIALFVWMMTTQ